VARRTALSGLAGALIAGLWLLLMLGVVGAVTRGPCRVEGFECLGQALVGAAIAVPVALAAGWPLLWLLRVRPAWPVALLGPLILIVVGWLGLALLPEHPLVVIALAALSYAMAGALSMRRSPR
jgi:hypothetical protein